MSGNEHPASNEKYMQELKSKLNGLLNQYSITKFESEDIVELIEEGESIDWIVDQLKDSSPKINADETAVLLAEIKSLVGPEKELEIDIAVSGENEATVETAVEGDIPDLSQVDATQLDLSQILNSLPPDVKLPPGMDVKQLKDLMESPRGKIMSDFLVFCQEQGIHLNEGSLADAKTQNLQSEWMSTPRDAFNGKTPAEMLEDSPALMPEKVKTFRREEPRVGRNDPCPCGSGKKYKKCCGRI